MKIRSLLSFFIIGTIVISVACGNSNRDTSTSTNQNSTFPTITVNPADSWIADGIINSQEYSGDMQYGSYSINWWSDGQFVYIGMRAQTSGFVAVGIQPGSRMKDADMIFGFVEDGQVSVFDLFSTGDFGPHPEDTQLGGTFDVIEFGGTEQNGITSIEFKRELSTNDEYDNSLSKGSNKIIWSFGSNDDLGGRHTVRGYGEIILDY